LSGPIGVVEYGLDWPERFRREADRIRAVLGDRVLQLEHAGSTSLPGLPAKPIIDMFLWSPTPPMSQPTSPHGGSVFSAGCPEIGRMLAFRDWLRTNASDRDLYAPAVSVQGSLARQT